MSDFEAFVKEIANQNPSAVSLGKWRDIIFKAQEVVESNPLDEDYLILFQIPEAK
jgi:hypothetical protein